MSQFPFSRFINNNSNDSISDTIIKNVEPTIKDDRNNSSINPQDHGHNSSNSISTTASDQELQDIDSAIMECLRDSINPQKFQAYFEDNFSLVNIENKLLNFLAATPFIQTMIESHYLGHIANAISVTLGEGFSMEIGVRAPAVERTLSSNNDNILNSINRGKQETQNLENDFGNGPKSVKEAKFTIDLNPNQNDLNSMVESKYIDHMQQDSENSLIINPSKTFDSFITGPCNHMAYSTSMAVAKKPGRDGRYQSLYIYGGSGLGKTHLLHAVANMIRENQPSLRICLISAKEFYDEMVSHIQNNNIISFKKKYSDHVDVLMIDDIHNLSGKKRTQEEFFHIFNELHQKGKQLILTSDKDPKDIQDLEERIRTRLQWGLIVDMQVPDLETRIAILKRKANELDLFVADDILALVASNIKNNIRQLEGALIRLSATTNIMNIELDMNIAKEILMLEDNNASKEITLVMVGKSVAQYFKVPLADLKSTSRSKEITSSRHVAMYLSYSMVKATLQEIGKYYGGRDHSSVIHGINKIKERLKTDSQLSKDIVYIENNI
ncbi:MAG: chromosomal replication initiator protein DnaA [Bdellovibrionales bacterium]|jgi:chromosomal replication initiator protein|nr:chromosomal replication initiator protein DnaA [Bdellovibrionales bacterium]MBT3525504.1 chromosomal replication initiator protein DnaA [Bdellovibrionales bacterium]MBT7670417.1 chromosomal replication initiator protein DnaA [Bdellovibrionales bacterium]MBT7765638.1 chromosomal replication initiator protein DnaA [Bdellovibrionales bacterium]